MKRSLFLICLTLFLSQLAFSQETSKDEWVKIETENKEVSFAVPADFSYSFDKEGFGLWDSDNSEKRIEYANVQTVAASRKDATVFFERYESSESERTLEFLLKLHPYATGDRRDFLHFKGLEVGSNNFGITSLYYFATGKFTYLIGAASRDSKNETILKFLSSSRLAGKSPFGLGITEATPPLRTFSLAELIETSVKVSYSQPKPAEVKPPSQINQPPKQVSNTPSVKSTGKKAALVLKPRGEYTNEARIAQTQGLVRILVILHSSGRVSSITVLSPLENGLTETAVRAAKRIRFIPAERDGVPISSAIQMEYSFTLF